MEKKNEIILFETEDKEIKLSVPVDVEKQTVWLIRNQMADFCCDSEQERNGYEQILV